MVERCHSSNHWYPRPTNSQGVEDISHNIEEVVDPHANKDEAVGIDDDDGTDIIDDRSIKQMDRQIRVTPNDCQRFGFSAPDAWILKLVHIEPTHITMTTVDSKCSRRFVTPARQNGV